VTAELVIRRATEADAEAGARMHIACWREGYAGIVPEQELADFTADEESWVQRWRTQIASGRPRHLALRGEEIVGFAVAGPDLERDTDVPVLYGIYVRASEYGNGLAQRLIELAIGDGPAALWVFADNPRARGFYARNGFVPTGESRTEDGLFSALEIRMVRAGR